MKSSIHHGTLDDELDRLLLREDDELDSDELEDTEREDDEREDDERELDRLDDDESAEAIVIVHRQVPTVAPSVLFQSLNSYSSLSWASLESSAH